MAANFALRLLQKVSNDSEVKIQVRVNLDLNRLWESIVIRSNSEALKRSGWIINCSLETVQFYVYNFDDLLRWIPNHRVHAQPGEKIEVHGGKFQRKHENLVVKKDNRGIAYNIKRNSLYIWTGLAMIEKVSNMEHFNEE